MKKRILVVDSAQLIRYSLKKALSQDMIDVDTVATASDAMDAVSSCVYDLCLIDIHLPVVGGFKLFDMIMARCPEMKVIMMTASDIDIDDEPNEKTRKTKKKTFHYLCKPFDLKQLKEAVGKALNEDDDTQNDSFMKNFAIISRRKSERKKMSKKIDFLSTVIIGGEIKRKSFTAETLDISDDGIGLISPCQLKVDDVISFGVDLEQKLGVVIWSLTHNEHAWRVGVRFA